MSVRSWLSSHPKQGMVMTMLYGLREKLRSRDAKSQIEALCAIAKERRQEFGDDVIAVFDSTASGEVRSRAAWALGKLHFRRAYGHLLVGLTDAEPQVREWSAWALGETGFHKSIATLTVAAKKENDDKVRRAIFGAVKKLRLEPTRSHITEVTRRLRPPTAPDPQVRCLVDNLASLEWPKDSSRISDLRKELRRTDPPYFAMYMDWVRRKPTVEQAITDSRYVYSDDLE